MYNKPMCGAKKKKKKQFLLTSKYYHHGRQHNHRQVHSLHTSFPVPAVHLPAPEGSLLSASPPGTTQGKTHYFCSATTHNGGTS